MLKCILIQQEGSSRFGNRNDSYPSSSECSCEQDEMVCLFSNYNLSILYSSVFLLQTAKKLFVSNLLPPHTPGIFSGLKMRKRHFRHYVTGTFPDRFLTITASSGEFFPLMQHASAPRHMNTMNPTPTTAANTHSARKRGIPHQKKGFKHYVLQSPTLALSRWTPTLRTL